VTRVALRPGRDGSWPRCRPVGRRCHGVFRDCRFNLSRHTDAAFVICTFTGCSFFEATFTECKLVGSRFDRCTFDPLTVTGGDWSFVGQAVVLVTTLGLQVGPEAGY